jgi:molybdopterin-guanine dinucleotide biosynthesis protein A
VTGPGTAGLVLAGGGASRLGGIDKPLLDVGGRSILHRVLQVLSGETATIAISANGDPGRFASFKLPILPDGPFAGRGPLAGILAGLDWAAALGAHSLLTSPGDTPFLPPGLSRLLAPAPACAASGGRSHYLVALWPVSVRDTLHQLLAADGPRAVGRFAASIGMRSVAFPHLPTDPFMNVNTPHDLARARAMVEGR